MRGAEIYGFQILRTTVTYLEPPKIDEHAEAILHMHGVKFEWMDSTMRWHLSKKSERWGVDANYHVAMDVMSSADAITSVVKILMGIFYDAIGKKAYDGN